MMELPPELIPEYGACVQLSERIWRVVCKNYGPFTYTGTGTYIIGDHSVAVIDPGPLDSDHLEALMTGLKGKTVSHILITHTHLDHSPLAAELAKRTGAKTYGFGPHGSGRKAGLEGEKVEAGADMDFTPDIVLKDGDIIEGDGWTIEAVHTPGHTSNHMCFALKEEECLFVGDHVMGWSTTVISPPDGDMRAYIESLRKVMERDEKLYYPTHGEPIEKARRFVSATIGHRNSRETQILRAIEDDNHSIEDIVSICYKDIDHRLHPAAARSVLAHLIMMEEDGKVATDGPVRISSQFKLIS